MIRLITLLFSILVTGCISKQNQPTLDYKVNNNIFHLAQSCIEKFSQKKENQTIFIKVKDNSDCSYSFDNFLRENIGKTVTVFFNGNLVFKNTRIMTPIITGNGFYQAVESKNMFDELVDSFN
ncbi:conserved hypothetical protein [Xenorhabdus bovienii str. kraussei Quebec]|uniref:Lipoprotein n=1 Tax=Xenorhabdus bovienii str. kraussei Quebec TaxID=1398203 RepID=A0A077PK61_XENBV|nr:hypothetical protein [Xenorhabdus bovienii]CDH20124.1 conserved hypothetical protein [Xenorhabdus bovienii str. kraussei Quebec]